MDRAAQMDVVLRLAGMMLHRSNVRPRFVECIQAFTTGIGNGPGVTLESLAESSALAHDRYYAPFFDRRQYILENYLVNEVLATRFPFVLGSVLEVYRAMVFNLATIQVMLVGIAGHYKELTDERVIQFIQSFARRSAHNDSYISKLTEAIASKDAPTFVEVMWMLRER